MGLEKSKLSGHWVYVVSSYSLHGSWVPSFFGAYTNEDRARDRAKALKSSGTHLNFPIVPLPIDRAYHASIDEHITGALLVGGSPEPLKSVWLVAGREVGKPHLMLEGVFSDEAMAWRCIEAAKRLAMDWRPGEEKKSPLRPRFIPIEMKVDAHQSFTEGLPGEWHENEINSYWREE